MSARVGLEGCPRPPTNRIRVFRIPLITVHVLSSNSNRRLFSCRSPSFYGFTASSRFLKRNPQCRARYSLTLALGCVPICCSMLNSRNDLGSLTSARCVPPILIRESIRSTVRGVLEVWRWNGSTNDANFARRKITAGWGSLHMVAFGEPSLDLVRPCEMALDGEIILWADFSPEISSI